MEDIEKILKKIGFTNAESKVYFSILKLGEAKVGNIIKLSGVSSSKVHDCLEKLVKKGIISYILKNNIKHFYPTKAKNLKILLKNKEEELNKQKKELNLILPKLENISKENIITQGAEIFTGINGIKNAFEKLYDKNKASNEESLFFNKMSKKNVKIINKFFKKLELNNKFRDINHRGICSLMYKEYFKSEKNPNVNMKYTNSPIPASTNIYLDKILLISWTREPIAFLIKSKDITNTFKDLFEEIWKNLK